MLGKNNWVLLMIRSTLRKLGEGQHVLAQIVAHIQPTRREQDLQTRIEKNARCEETVDIHYKIILE
jgi:hypothetical protein